MESITIVLGVEVILLESSHVDAETSDSSDHASVPSLSGDFAISQPPVTAGEREDGGEETRQHVFLQDGQYAILMASQSQTTPPAKRARVSKSSGEVRASGDENAS